MSEPRLPLPVKAAVSNMLGDYYTHSKINTLFGEAGAPGEPPVGMNKVDKIREWLTRSEKDPDVDVIAVLGHLLCEFMEEEIPEEHIRHAGMAKLRQRITEVLAKHGLSYHSGGRVLGATAGAPSKTLEGILRAADLGAVQTEFDRALASVESDPADALTAACTIIESYCRIYIEDHSLVLPSKQTIGELWPVVRAHLKLEPKQQEDVDIATILGALGTLVVGIGAFRTHAGDAHGKGRTKYKVEPRHARLAIHSAHTLVGFLIETAKARQR